MYDILKGHDNKLKNEAKVLRRAAYLIIASRDNVKNLSEESFNNEFWPIDEIKQSNGSFEKQIEKAQETLKQHNLKLSEARRLKNKK